MRLPMIRGPSFGSAAQWVRQGECNHCGWCCQFEGIQRNVVRPEGRKEPLDARFYELRGANVGADGAFRFLVHLYAPCSAHDVGALRCSIYEERPETCRAFPSVPEQIEGTPCSYWFEGQTEAGHIVRRGGNGSSHPTPPRFTR